MLKIIAAPFRTRYGTFVHVQFADGGVDVYEVHRVPRLGYQVRWVEDHATGSWTFGTTLKSAVLGRHANLERSLGLARPSDLRDFDDPYFEHSYPDDSLFDDFPAEDLDSLF